MAEFPYNASAARCANNVGDAGGVLTLPTVAAIGEGKGETGGIAVMAATELLRVRDVGHDEFGLGRVLDETYRFGEAGTEVDPGSIALVRFSGSVVDDWDDLQEEDEEEQAKLLS